MATGERARGWMSQLELQTVPILSVPPQPLPLDKCLELVEAAVAPFGKPATLRTSELYTVMAVSDMGGSGPQVIYPPEFIYLLDFGYEAFAGVSVFWQPKALGDPEFPDFSDFKLRSVPSRSERDLIFPKVAGSLLIGTQPGTAPDAISAGFQAAGLQDLTQMGDLWSASCHPFMESAVCTQLTDSLPFVRYANRNAIVRNIDFGPGWRANRIF